VIEQVESKCALTAALAKAARPFSAARETGLVFLL
jgi:hypothetical protein